nr:hypothetical protein [Streptomyces sp. Ag109_O5-10]
MVQVDPAEYEPAPLGLAADSDPVVAAGNVFPLLAAGTGVTVVKRPVADLRPGGPMVAGFGLDEAHLPVPPGITLPEYDECCVAAGLTLVDRFASWDAVLTSAAAAPSASTVGGAWRPLP